MIPALAVLHISWSWSGIKAKKIKTKSIVICLGNIHVSGDDVCLKYATLKQNHPLKNYEFIACHSLDDFIHLFESNLKFYILDVIKGITKPQTFTDLDNFNSRKNYSLHDFDISSYLKIQKNLGVNRDITIIGVPESITFNEIDKIFLELDN